MSEQNKNTVLRRILPLMLGMSLAIPAIPASGQGIGTLFTSPQERQYLDYLREENLRQSRASTFNIQEDVIPDIPIVQDEVVEEARPEVALYQFGGIMVRRNGSRMVWLNGSQVAESELPGNMTLVVSGGDTLLSIRANGNIFRLKPGQTADVTGNRVLEPFQQSASPAATPAVQAAPLPEPDPVVEAAASENVEGETASAAEAPAPGTVPEDIPQDVLDAIDQGIANDQQRDLFQALLDAREEGADAQP